MEIRSEILWIILGSAAVTVIPRVLPLMVLSRFKLPDWSMRWLNHVPVSIMAALVAQELLIQDGKLAPLATNAELFAAVPAFLVAIFTRSLLGTVTVGIVSLMLLRLVLPG